jgi:hypothetical protein
MTDTLERQMQQAPELPPPETPRRPIGMGPIFLSALAVLVVAVVAFILSGGEEVAGTPAVIETATPDAVVEAPAPIGLTRAQQAEVQRWEGLAEAYATVIPGPDGLTAVQRAEALRWTQLAESLDLTEARAAESLRLTALAEWLTADAIGDDGLTDVQRVEAERLTALAERLLNG